MNRLLVAILALILVGNPLLVHHAGGSVDDGHRHAAADHHASYVADQDNSIAECLDDCAEEQSGGCHTFVEAHCSLTMIVERPSADALVLTSRKIVSGYADDTRQRLMAEAETPPPRI